MISCSQTILLLMLVFIAIFQVHWHYLDFAILSILPVFSEAYSALHAATFWRLDVLDCCCAEPPLLFFKQTRFQCSILSPVTKMFVTSGVCSSDKKTPIYFPSLSKVWSISHLGSVGRGHKKCLSLSNFVYHYQICVFIIFISFFISFFFFFILMKYQIFATEY